LAQFRRGAQSAGTWHTRHQPLASSRCSRNSATHISNRAPRRSHGHSSLTSCPLTAGTTRTWGCVGHPMRSTEGRRRPDGAGVADRTAPAFEGRPDAHDRDRARRTTCRGHRAR
jgi:hypothetical protein